MAGDELIEVLSLIHRAWYCLHGFELQCKALIFCLSGTPWNRGWGCRPQCYWFSEFRKYKSGRRCQQLAPSPLPTVPLWHHSDLKSLLIIPCLLASLRCLCLLRQHQVTMQLFSASEYRGMEVVWIQSIGQAVYLCIISIAVVRLHTSVGFENSIVKYQC